MEQRLITLKEFSEYTGFGMTKCRELVKRQNNNFSVRLGSKYFIDVDRFENEQISLRISLGAKCSKNRIKPHYLQYSGVSFDTPFFSL